jgi:hypothetical protein
MHGFNVGILHESLKFVKRIIKSLGEISIFRLIIEFKRHLGQFELKIYLYNNQAPFGPAYF